MPMPESSRLHGPVIEPTIQPSAEPNGRKDQFLRDKPGNSAVIRCRLGSFPLLETRLIPSSRCIGTDDGRRPVKGPSNCVLQNDILKRASRNWWSQTGSNRRPPACKAGALPTELWPRRSETPGPSQKAMVGLGRLELPTSRLSGVRSNRAELQAHESRIGVMRASSHKPFRLGEMSL